MIVLSIIDNWMLLKFIFVCKKCIDKLIDFYVAIFNGTNIDRMISFVNTFNSKHAHVDDRWQVYFLKFFISNVLYNRSNIM